MWEETHGQDIPGRRAALGSLRSNLGLVPVTHFVKCRASLSPSFSSSTQHIAKYLQAEAVKKDRLDFHQGWKGYFKMVSL